MIQVFSHNKRDFLNVIDLSEKYLQNFLVNHWNQIFPNLKFITTELELLGQVRSNGSKGRVDIVAFNPAKKRLVILELKKYYDKNIGQQVADYQTAIRKRPHEVYVDVKEKYNFELPSFSQLNFDTIEVIMIAQTFTESQIDYAQTHSENCTLISYKWVESDIVSINNQLLIIDYLNNAPSSNNENNKSPEITDYDIDNIAKKVYELIKAKEPDKEKFDRQVRELINKLYQTPYYIEEKKKEVLQEEYEKVVKSTLGKLLDIVENVITEKKNEPKNVERRILIENEVFNKESLYKKYSEKYYLGYLLDIFQAIGNISFETVIRDKFNLVKFVLDIEHKQKSKTIFLGFSVSGVYVQNILLLVNDEEIFKIIDLSKQFDGFLDIFLNMEERFVWDEFSIKSGFKRKLDTFEINENYKLFLSLPNDTCLKIFAYLLFVEFGLIEPLQEINDLINYGK